MPAVAVGPVVQRAELAGPMRPANRPPAARPSRRTALRVTASLETPDTSHPETSHLFSSRVGASGYQMPKRMQGLHPIAREAWESVHAIYGACFETPLVPAPWLRDMSDAAAVHLKAENRQPGGSYRLRGVVHKLQKLNDEQLARGLAAAGSVNHTLAVLHAAAAAAKQRGGSMRVPVREFLPRGAPAAHAERLRSLGGEVVEGAGAGEAEAEVAARAAAAAEGLFYVDAHNDPQVAGGLGSIGIELLMQLPLGRLDAVFVPMGSGGLASGIAAALKAAAPSVRVVACRPSTIDRLRGVLSGPPPAAAAAADAKAGSTEADEAAAAAPPELVDEVVEVPEEEVARAVVETTSHSGMQVDAATGVAVAAFQRVARAYSGKHVVIVVCSGNITTEGLQQVYAVAGRGRAPAAAGTAAS